MKQKLFAIALGLVVGLFLVGCQEQTTKVQGTDTSTEQSVNDDTATPRSEKEKDVTKQGSEEAESPSAEEKAIYQEFSARVDSDENPVHAEIPEGISKDEYGGLVMEFRGRLFEEVGSKYNKSPAEVQSILTKVVSWRASQGLAPGGY